MTELQAAPASALKRRQILEEVANSVTHGVGTALSIAGLVILVTMAARRGDAWHVTSFAIFGSSLVLLYLASTLYHSLPQGASKRLFRVIDHACIYLLIAGTYTPFTLTVLRGPMGWTLFGLVWGLALAGVIFKVFMGHRYRIFSTIAYVLIGWVAVIAVKQMVEVMPLAGFLWIVAGGLAYTFGVVFYAYDKRVPYFHAAWHLMVMTGSLCHFVAILFYILP